MFNKTVGAFVMVAALLAAACNDGPTSSSGTLDLTGRYRVTETVSTRWTNCTGVTLRGTSSTISVTQTGTSFSAHVLSTESTLQVHSESIEGTVDGNFARVNRTINFDSRAGSGRLIAGAYGEVTNPSSFNLFGDGNSYFASCEIEFDYIEHWQHL